MRAFRATVVIAASIVAASALGGTALAAETREAFVAKADPICAAANRDIARLNKRSESLHDRGRHEAAGAVLSKTGTRLSRSIDKVRAIGAPPGDEKTINRWLKLVQRVANNNVKMGRAHVAGELDEQARLGRQNDRVRSKAHRLVAAWGFGACVGR